MPETNIKDEDAVKANIKTFAEAWNTKNAIQLAGLFTQDADFVMVLGIWWKGRTEIEKNHEQLFLTLMRESRLIFPDIKIKFIKPDVAIAHSVWELTGQQSPEADKLPPRQGVLSCVMTQQNDKWLIVTLHNTDTVMLTEYKPYNK